MDIDRDLSSLYTGLGPKLLGYFRQQRATAEVAEDLLQEMFVRALRRPQRLRQARSPQAYLFGIARHLRLDAMRRRRLEDGDLGLVAPALADVDPRLDELRTAVDALPETHRETLLLKLREELSYEEIAQVLEIPIGTVRSRLHYAVSRLRQALTADREDCDEA